MRASVQVLLDRLQILTQIHDIRQFSPMLTHEADKIQKKCDFDYLGDLRNTLAWLTGAIEDAQQLQDERMQQEWLDRQEITND